MPSVTVVATDGTMTTFNESYDCAGAVRRVGRIQMLRRAHTLAEGSVPQYMWCTVWENAAGSICVAACVVVWMKSGNDD